MSRGIKSMGMALVVIRWAQAVTVGLSLGYRSYRNNRCWLRASAVVVLSTVTPVAGSLLSQHISVSSVGSK